MKINVMLVDDEKKFATMLALRLILRDIDADCFFTGEEALQEAKKKCYDVAILDVKMPGISGIKLMRKLTELLPGMKIIFLTGHGSKNDFETGTGEGSEYLAKPLQIEKLVDLLHQLTA